MIGDAFQGTTAYFLQLFAASKTALPLTCCIWLSVQIIMKPVDHQKINKFFSPFPAGAFSVCFVCFYRKVDFVDGSKWRFREHWDSI